MLGLQNVFELEERLIDFVEERKGFQVFVSHDAEDEELARRIEAEADSVGVEAWLFEEDNEPGTPVRKQVQGAIEDSDVFAVLLTENSSVSAYVHQEIGFAEGTETPVIPLVHESYDREQLAMLIGRDQIRFRDGDVDKAVSELKHYTKEKARESAKKGVRQGLFVIGILSWLWWSDRGESSES